MDYRLEFRNRTDIGMNESRFLFVLDIIVLNLLDEGRRTYVGEHNIIFIVIRQKDVLIVEVNRI